MQELKKRNSDHHTIKSFSKKRKEVNREIMDITELALANILDVIPRMFNTGDEVDPLILRIYERNAAVLVQNDQNNGMHNNIDNTIP